MELLESNRLSYYSQSMKKYVGKFGTDARYPHWTGGALDYNFFNSATALALFLNWGIIAYIHYDFETEKIISLWGKNTTAHFVLAVAICLVTSWLIRHHDRFIVVFTRSFACGIPMALNLLLFLQRLMSS